MHWVVALAQAGTKFGNPCMRAGMSPSRALSRGEGGVARRIAGNIRCCADIVPCPAIVLAVSLACGLAEGWALFICKSLGPVSETNARQGCCSHRARDLLRAHEAAAGCGDGRYNVLRRSMMLVAASAQRGIGMCDSLRHRGRLLAFICAGW